MRRKLRTAEQQTVVSFGAGWSTTLSTIFCPGPGWVTTVNIGGRAFTLKQASARMVAINEIAARSRFDLRDFLDPKTGEPLPRAYEELSVRELLDDTGTRILYTSGRHFGLYAGAGVTFSDQRWLRFPVRGTNRANAIMTAVDQAGNKVARYRIIGPKLGQIIRGNTVEITVHPGQELTDGLVVAIAISAPWLSSYFAREGGGG